MNNNINNLSKLLYSNLDINRYIIYDYDIDILINLKNNGIISLLICYYTKLNDIQKLNYKINKIKLYNLKLLKRDYLNIIKFYYNTNNELYIKYLNELKTKINNNPEIIIHKDIDFILNNNINELLLNLDGFFIKTSINDNLKLSLDEYYKLKFYKLDNIIVNNIILFIENNINKNLLQIINTIFLKIKNEENITIIDSGNIINNYKGTITQQSLINLENILNLLIKKNIKPFIIIHNKHIKNIPDLKNFLKNKNCFYFLTPYKFNDDIFILLFFFKLININNNVFIISNDNFDDHLNTLKNIYLNSNFKYIFKQYILKYTLNPYFIYDIPKYSLCIQVIYDKINKSYNVYIPHSNSFFILYKIKEE